MATDQVACYKSKAEVDMKRYKAEMEVYLGKRGKIQPDVDDGQKDTPIPRSGPNKNGHKAKGPVADKNDVAPNCNEDDYNSDSDDEDYDDDAPKNKKGKKRAINE